MPNVNLLRVSASMAIALMLVPLLSCRGELEVIDGPVEEIVGFPFVWVKDGANSLELDVSLSGLIFDVLTYFTVICLVLNFRSRFFPLRQSVSSTVIALCGISTVVLWWFVLSVSDIHWTGWLLFIFSENVKNVTVELLPIIS